MKITTTQKSCRKYCPSCPNLIVTHKRVAKSTALVALVALIFLRNIQLGQLGQ